MINIPYNVPLMAQITPSQNIPVQTSQNNFQTFQQPQTVTQQMQTQPCTNPQDTYKQPFYQLHQADVFFANHQYIPNALPPRNPYPVFQPSNVPPPLQTQPNCGSLSPSVLEQIRGCVSNPAPIFILPGSCHQSTNHHQQPPPMCPPSQGGVAQPTGQSTSFNCPPSICCPPSFYPYPIPLPIYEPFAGQTRGKDGHQACGCCHRHQGCTEPRIYPLSCCCNLNESEEHCCGPTNDDTICSKRNCPASISLQALASQFLALPGIISCAATRLILRKVPGSNITTTMEDTMEKAQRSISVLTKEQLLAESRIAQQVNALINLHMTTALPANIIPLLTLLQLKVNVLKAQVEALITKKVMECHGFGFEVETSGPIDPAVLALKTNAELRQLLSALRQKECDEHLNANFSPYHSQRVIAEARLNAVQAKIRQVEAEFENRRCPPLTAPTLTSRIIQQFAESRCTFGFAQTKLFEPYIPENVPVSPDPFEPSPRNPRRLYIQPYVPEPPAPQRNEQNRGTSTSKDAPSTSQDKGTGEGSVDDTKDRSPGRRCSADSCSCDRSSSEESLEEGKKKLRLRIDRAGHVRISNVAGMRNVPLMKLAANVVAVIDVEEVAEVGQLAIPDCDSPWSRDAGSFINEKTSSEDLKDEETHSKGIVEDGAKDAKREVEEESLKDDGAELRFESERVSAEPENNDDVKASDYEGVSIKKGESKENGGNEASKELREGIENPRTLETDESGRDTVTNGSSRINPGDDESRRENGAERNVRIVAMVTNIKYDRRFGDFERWMVINECSDERTVDRCGRNAADESLGDTKEENETDGNYTCLLSEKIDPLARSVDRGCEPWTRMTAKNEEMHWEVKTNVYSKNTYEGESNFEMNRMDDQKMAKQLKRFPPLKHATANAGATIGFSENIFHQKEIESGSSRIVYDRSTSYHCDTEPRKSIVSAIYTMIEHQLDSLSSLLGNIPNLHSFLFNLYSDKLFGNNDTVSLNQENINSLEQNKKLISRKDNWILLPPGTDILDDKEQNVSNKDCIFVGDQCCRIRKIKQLIIKGKENKNHAVTGGSIGDQLRVLSRNGLKRPCKVRRSLIIRSRLKNPGNPKHECSPPFAILKRLKRNDIFTPRATKQTGRKLRIGQRFCSLPDASNIAKMSRTIILSNNEDSLNQEVLAKVPRNAALRQNKSAGAINCTIVSVDRSLHDNSIVPGTNEHIVERISRFY